MKVTPISARVAKAFDKARAEKRFALLCYVMAGDPDLETSRAIAEAVLEGGADLLELGVPFSDPIADGPTLQRAATRALQHRTHLGHCLELAASLRTRFETPIALMSYLNPLLAFSKGSLGKACHDAGVDALIVPDLPPEESGELRKELTAHEVGMVHLLAPTSDPARIEAACASTAFIYYVSVTGVTGARKELPAELPKRLDELRARSPVPVVVGFGVSTPDQAKALGAHADGVVVGSALVAHAVEGGPKESAPERARAMVKALRGL